MPSEAVQPTTSPRLTGNPLAAGTDWLLAAGLALVTSIFVQTHVHHPIQPMEDASMLLRYSQHLAEGHGVVWNIGDHPVEGATDFLFMALIGILSRAFHASVSHVAEAILFVSQVVSTVVLYFGLRTLYRGTRPLAAGFALVLGLGIGYHFVDTGFSAPFYSLFAMLTWITGVVCIQRGVTWPRALLFSVLAFTTGMIRPDGVILAILILCSTLYGIRERRLPLIVTFGALFAVCGGAYFLWRIHYFGYPFPNPFYVKSAHVNHMNMLKLSLRQISEMLLLAFPLAGFAFRSRAGVRRLTAWLITFIPFVFLWMMIINDNNHFSRFQYVLVPLSLLELFGFTTAWWDQLKTERPTDAAVIRRPAAVVFLLLLATSIFYNMHLYREAFSNRGGQALAERLRPYASKGYTLLATEAGDIPFYSEWRTIDLIGLNDATIAHNKGIITEQYLEQINPDVILYRDFAYRMHEADVDAAAHHGVLTSDNQLTRDARLTRDYAVAHHYILAAKWGGTYCDYHTYWVKPGLADTDALVSAIRDHPYYTQGDGQLSYDFRNAPDPTLPCMINHL